MDYYYSPMQSNTNYSKYSLKFFLALVFCLLVRLFPFRAPNIEPILATMMPIGRAYGALFGFSFGVLSIFLYDVATGTLGVRTLFTAGAYGLIGLWAVRYFSAKGVSVSGGKNSDIGTIDYVKFAVMGTLLFDALTGFTVGPIFFNQSFVAAFAGQIPFTALHLLGNVTFAAVLSPGIYNFLIKKKKKESVDYIKILNPKII
jgi:hypothetical protein